jgi:hypothetical protein
MLHVREAGTRTSCPLWKTRNIVDMVDVVVVGVHRV